MQVETQYTPRFVIERCSLVNQWAWNTNNDFCPICRNSVNEESIVMENEPDCCSHIVVGACGHAFHYDCIEKWLKTSSKVCPLCNTQWVYKTKPQYNNQSTNTVQTESIGPGLPPLPNININQNIANLINNNTTQMFNMPPGLSVSSSNNQTWSDIAQDNSDSWGPPPEPLSINAPVDNNNSSSSSDDAPQVEPNNDDYDDMPDLVSDTDSMPDLEEVNDGISTPLMDVILEHPPISPIFTSNSNMEESIVNDSDDDAEIVD